MLLLVVPQQLCNLPTQLAQLQHTKHSLISGSHIGVIVRALNSASPAYPSFSGASGKFSGEAQACRGGNLEDRLSNVLRAMPYRNVALVPHKLDPAGA